MENQDNKLVIVQPDAANVIASSLATLTGVTDYTSVMISEELKLAAQIAELKKTETVLQAVLAEFTRKRENLERRQRAIQATHNSGSNYNRY